MLHKKLLLCLTVALLAFGLGGCPAVPFIVKDQRDLSAQSADKGIESKIKTQLVQENASKSLDVNVYSFLGHVYLIGDVDAGYRAFAEKTARSVPGVKQVTTHWFPVGSANRATDSQIEAAIDTNLLFAKDVASTQVNVDVWGGHVVLLGLMASQADIDRAMSEVRGVSGVKSVTSYLRVHVLDKN